MAELTDPPHAADTSASSAGSAAGNICRSAGTASPSTSAARSAASASSRRLKPGTATLPRRRSRRSRAAVAFLDVWRASKPTSSSSLRSSSSSALKACAWRDAASRPWRDADMLLQPGYE